jgi:hypothetical protein
MHVLCTRQPPPPPCWPRSTCAAWPAQCPCRPGVGLPWTRPSGGPPPGWTRRRGSCAPGGLGRGHVPSRRGRAGPRGGPGPVRPRAHGGLPRLSRPLADGLPGPGRSVVRRAPPRTSCALGGRRRLPARLPRRGGCLCGRGALGRPVGVRGGLRGRARLRPRRPARCPRRRGPPVGAPSLRPFAREWPGGARHHACRRAPRPALFARARHGAQRPRLRRR